jgi:hypothetical protein
MGLYIFHCVLIASAALFFAGFGVYSLIHAERGATYTVMGAGSLLIAVAVAVYLIYFIRKLVRLHGAGEIR